VVAVEHYSRTTIKQLMAIAMTARKIVLIMSSAFTQERNVFSKAKIAEILIDQDAQLDHDWRVTLALLHRAERHLDSEYWKARDLLQGAKRHIEWLIEEHAAKNHPAQRPEEPVVMSAKTVRKQRRKALTHVEEAKREVERMKKAQADHRRWSELQPLKGLRKVYAQYLIGAPKGAGKGSTKQ